jgi:sporulation protein YlmC with PRC-barrel domain
MKTTWKTAAALGMAFCLAVVTQAFAQENEKSITERVAQKVAGGQQVCLASKVQGMTVKDKANQNVGQIQDLVIDQSGQVKFLAIAAQEGATDTPAARRQPGQPGQPQLGGAANQNQKLTLIPFEQAQFHEGETATQNYVSLNLDKDRITQAPSFTRMELTAKGQEAQWMSRVKQFYGNETGAARPDFNPNEEKKPEERE